MKLIKRFNSGLILSLLIIISYITLAIDTIKYPGSVANHFFIDAKVYFALSITILLFIKTKTRILDLILKVNKIFLPIISTFYIVLILLEGAHYRNYILNILNIHIEGLVVVVLFSLAIFLADKFRLTYPKLKTWPKVFYFSMIFLLLLYVVKNAALTANMAFNRNSYILFHLGDTYDQRLTYEWGKQYQFMVFVRDNTPSDATIVIPPEQDPWLMGSGNGTFVRAFLFPRKIVQETLIISEEDIKEFSSSTYILIDWGKEECKPDPECHGWPRQNISATRITYMSPDLGTVSKVQENTLYKLKESQYVYGIIEI